MTDYLDAALDFTDPDVVSTWDEAPLWTASFGLLMLRELPFTPDAEILDLACGAGFPFMELAMTRGRTARTTGIDIWPAGLARARAKLRAYPLPQATLVRGDGERLPFADSCIDLITCNLGVNNFADLDRVLAECARVTKPGGRLALTTNPRGHMREFYDCYRDVLRDIGMPDDLERLETEEAHRPTADTLAKLLASAGYEVERTVEEPLVLRYADAASFFRHRLIAVGFIGAWRDVVGRERAPAIFAELERRLDERRPAGGPLALTVPMLYLQARRESAG